MLSVMFHFLPTYAKQASFAMERPAMKMIKELHKPQPIESSEM